jgi:hypothetical protein
VSVVAFGETPQLFPTTLEAAPPALGARLAAMYSRSGTSQTSLTELLHLTSVPAATAFVDGGPA